MSQQLRCHCGWAGTVESLDYGRCPACRAELSTGAIPPSGPEVASTATPASAPPTTPGVPTGSPPENVVVRLLQIAWNYTGAALYFYFDQRKRILAGWRVWINEHMPSFDSPDAIRREIRIALEEQEGVHEEADVWHVDLPPRCVVCGGKATGGWVTENRTVLDPYGPIVGPLAGLIVGFYLSWWYQSHLWLLLSLLLGMVGGYAARRDVRFVLRFMRCGKHAEPGRVPELLVLQRYLVIRVGSREVKLAFLQRGRDVEPLEEIKLPTELMVAPHHEMISLAEEVHPGTTIVADDSSRLPAAHDENEPHPPAGPDEYRLAR